MYLAREAAVFVVVVQQFVLLLKHGARPALQPRLVFGNVAEGKGPNVHMHVMRLVFRRQPEEQVAHRRENRLQTVCACVCALVYVGGGFRILGALIHNKRLSDMTKADINN